MVSERSKQSRGSVMVSGGGSDEWSSDLQKLLDRAPQFGALAKASVGRGLELSPSQQQFLDDFVQRLGDREASDDNVSTTEADVDGREKDNRKSQSYS